MSPVARIEREQYLLGCSLRSGIDLFCGYHGFGLEEM
jgi:hypothetical protein